MSSVFNRLVRVSTLTNQRSGNRYSLLQYVKWCHDETHYQHGIPGIPTDGKVVLLKNSNTGSQIYLVGTTNHVCKGSPQLVKKVIDSIRPDAIAIAKSREGISWELRSKNWEPVNVNENWFSMFLRSMSPSRLQDKMHIFTINGIIKGEEFKVALEESQKLKAKLVAINQHDDIVFYKKVPLPLPISWKTLILMVIPYSPFNKQMMKIKSIVDKDSREYTRQGLRLLHIFSPEIYKVMVEDKDMHMFTMLRRMEDRLIVAVVGMGDMDEIELLWKRAEDGDADKLLLATSEYGIPQTGDV